MIQVAVSIGELVDKVSILAIKRAKIKDPEKLRHIEKEYAILVQSMAAAGIPPDGPELARLREINEKLWDIEDRIRLKEAAKVFDDEFIALARSVYFINDDRAAVKKIINLKYGSDLVEEKQYADYK